MIGDVRESAISVRDRDAPCLSICQAAFMHSILAVSISINDSATKSWIICFSASSEPCE